MPSVNHTVLKLINLADAANREACTSDETVALTASNPR